MKKNLIKYRLVNEHLSAVKRGDYEYARVILRLLRERLVRIGLGDDAGFRAECFAEKAGCHISYSRNYGSATIRF